MRRFLAAISAIALGLLVTSACGYLNGHINWPISQTRKHRCYDIEHCNVPWWIIVLFVGMIFGPSLVYGVVAFFGTGRCWSLTRWCATFAVLALLTICLYLGEHAYRSFT